MLTVNDLKCNLSVEWRQFLDPDEKLFDKPYWTRLLNRINETKEFYPEKVNIFAALNECSPDNVKVVIIGQDPYVHPKQAHGFAFSVRQGTRLPPSLLNILAELRSEYNVSDNARLLNEGNLTEWAHEGVLLLNSVLTVAPRQVSSHVGYGWENFTSEIIRRLDEQGNIVFVGWGGVAAKVLEGVQSDKLLCGHPSPMARGARNPFSGCGHFMRINELLIAKNILPIRWLKIFDV